MEEGERELNETACVSDIRNHHKVTRHSEGLIMSYHCYGQFLLNDNVQISFLMYYHQQDLEDHLPSINF